MEKFTENLTIVVWGEDWNSDSDLEIQDTKPIIHWTAMSKEMQTTLLDMLFMKLNHTYPTASFIDTGLELRIPEDYEPIEPTQEFDKRLRKLYSSAFHGESQ